MNPTPTGPWDPCLDNGIATFKCIPIGFSLLIKAMLVFAGIIALVFIIWAGFNMITSGGDPKKVEGAKRILTYTLIGLTIVLLSFAIIFFIGYVTGTSACITNFSDMSKFLTGCQ